MYLLLQVRGLLYSECPIFVLLGATQGDGRGDYKRCTQGDTRAAWAQQIFACMNGTYFRVACSNRRRNQPYI